MFFAEPSPGALARTTVVVPVLNDLVVFRTGVGATDEVTATDAARILASLLFPPLSLPLSWALVLSFFSMLLAKA
jgi:hypothetical protein